MWCVSPRRREPLINRSTPPAHHVFHPHTSMQSMSKIIYFLARVSAGADSSLRLGRGATSLSVRRVWRALPYNNSSLSPQIIDPLPPRAPPAAAARQLRDRDRSDNYRVPSHDEPPRPTRGKGRGGGRGQQLSPGRAQWPQVRVDGAMDQAEDILPSITAAPSQQLGEVFTFEAVGAVVAVGAEIWRTFGADWKIYFYSDCFNSGYLGEN